MALLPMSPALSAALSRGGGPSTAPSAAVTPRTATTKPPAPGRGVTASVVALAHHPSLPRVAYVSEEVESAGAGGGRPPAIVRQTLVVSRHGSTSTPSRGERGEELLATLPLEKLPGRLDGFRRGRHGRSTAGEAPVTLATLGPIKSITFLDRDAVHWSTCRRRDGSGSDFFDVSPLDCGGVVRTPAPVADAGGPRGGAMGTGVVVGLQFARSLAVLRLGPSSGGDGGGPEVLCFLEGQRSSGKAGRPGHRPTSPPLPVTESVFVYGCSDGAMRFHNLVPGTVRTESGGKAVATRQSTVKSVRGPNGRNDHVCRVVCVDVAHRGGDERSGVASKGDEDEESSHLGSAVGDGNGALSLRTRLVTVCASGVAYAWDVRYSVDRASGTLRDLNVLPVSFAFHKLRLM